MSFVGAGPGDPELITLKGLRRLRDAEVVIHDRLVPLALLDEVPPGAEVIDAGKAPGRQCLGQAGIDGLLVDRGRRGRRVVRLKGGDPALFARLGEEIRAVKDAGLAFEIVPGGTAATAAAPLAGIPLTERSTTSTVVLATAPTTPAGSPRTSTGHCWPGRTPPSSSTWRSEVWQPSARAAHARSVSARWGISWRGGRAAATGDANPGAAARSCDAAAVMVAAGPRAGPVRRHGPGPSRRRHLDGPRDLVEELDDAVQLRSQRLRHPPDQVERDRAGYPDGREERKSSTMSATMAKALRVELELPDDAFGEDFDQETFCAKVREAAVMRLLREHRISQGKAAELLGLSRDQCLSLMASHGVPVVDLSPEELDLELRQATAVFRRPA